MTRSGSHLFSLTLPWLLACAAESQGGPLDESEGTANTSDAPGTSEDTGIDEHTGGDESTGGELPNDCTTLATGVTLTEVSIFQILRTRAWADGEAVAPADRAVPVVEGRPALIRARIEVGADWSPRQLSARVEIDTPAGRETFLDPRFLGSSSDASDPSSDFLVELPPQVVQSGAQYSVSIVDCAASTAAPSTAARYPAEGTADLGATATGPIAIHLVPFEIGGFVPDTSADVLDGFRDAVMSVYPVTDVAFTVGPVVPDQNGGVVDVGDILVRLGVIQEQEDQAAPEIYYYGLVSGAATRGEYCSSCPTGSSESGNGMRAAFAVGAAFADELSESTLIHELGHMHGLLHAPCGDPELTDDAFPYEDAAITVEGYDFRTDEFIATDTKDLMGYCQPRWVSDYHYRKLVDWVQLAQTW